MFPTSKEILLLAQAEVEKRLIDATQYMINAKVNIEKAVAQDVFGDDFTDADLDKIYMLGIKGWDFN